MKWFAFQRGPSGVEPIIFHDEPSVSKAHKIRILPGTLREIPEALETLSLAQLVEVKWPKE